HERLDLVPFVARDVRAGRDVDHAGAVHRDAVGRHGATVVPGLHTPLGEERPVAGELLDAQVSGVGDVHVAAPIDGDAAREEELPVRRADAPPGAYEGAVARELLDAMV